MRLIGHPARIKGLRDFMDYVSSFPDVWLCKREDIAKHWLEHFPYTDDADAPSTTPSAGAAKL
jgi:allantoinase